MRSENWESREGSFCMTAWEVLCVTWVGGVVGGVEVDACGARFESDARDKTPGRREGRCLLESTASADAPGD